jgi:uncharacterized membrane protein
MDRRTPILAFVFIAATAALFGYTAYHLRLPERFSRWLDGFSQGRGAALVAVVVLVALGAFYSLHISAIAIDNHLSFNTGRIDLGWYVNMFRRSSIGDPLGCTLCGTGNHLAGHFDPILVILSPLYLIYPEAETVLVLQTLWLASGIVPIYLLSRHYTQRVLPGLVLAACYLAYPALHGVNLFDFHSLALVVPVAIWLVYLFELGHTKSYFATFALFLLIREDASLIAITIGLAILLTGRRHALKVAVPTILISAVYLFVVKAFIMVKPDLLNQSGGGKGYGYYYAELLPKGASGVSGLVSTLLSDPTKVIEIGLRDEKVIYAIQILLPVLFLPLLASWGKMMLSYGFAFTLLATRPFVPSLHFHYSSLLVPFVFALTAQAISTKRLTELGERFSFDSRRMLRGLLVAMLVSTAILSTRFGGAVPNSNFRGGFRALKRNPSEEKIEKDRWLKNVCKRLPKDARVMTSSPLIPHLGRCRNLILQAKFRSADYVVWPSLDAREDVKGKMSKALRKDFKSGYLVELERAQNLSLYKTNYPENERHKQPTSE